VAAVSEAGTADTKVLHKAEVLHLMPHELRVEQVRLLVVVGFDAADIGGLLLHECVDEGVQAGLELCTRGNRTLQGVEFAYREDRCDDGVFALNNEDCREFGSE
jgi:hypothetical protein